MNWWVGIATCLRFPRRLPVTGYPSCIMHHPFSFLYLPVSLPSPPLLTGLERWSVHSGGLSTGLERLSVHSSKFFHLSNLDFYFGQLLRKKAVSSINSPLLFHSTGPRTRSACPPQ